MLIVFSWEVVLELVKLSKAGGGRTPLEFGRNGGRQHRETGRSRSYAEVCLTLAGVNQL
jgi:hypothetical protein